MSAPAIYVGIDPGLDGAVAIMAGGDTGLVDLHVVDAPSAKVKKGRAFLPAVMAAQLEAVRLAYGVGIPTLVALEDIGGVPPMGSKLTIGKQFRGIGIWEGILAGMGLPYELVRPQRWKRDLAIPTGSPKGASITLAARLFPSMSRGGYLSRAKDDGRADALLLAEWARRQGSGTRGGDTGTDTGEGAAGAGEA